MKRFYMLLLMAMAIPFLSFRANQTPVNAVPPTVTVEEMVIDTDVFNDCTGEWVHISGRARVVIVSNVNNNRITGTWHTNLQGVQGVGLSSGNTYHVSGVSNQPFSSPLTHGANTISLVSRLQMVGGGSRFTVRSHFHGTMNAGGTITVLIDRFEMTC